MMLLENTYVVIAAWLCSCMHTLYGWYKFNTYVDVKQICQLHTLLILHTFYFFALKTNSCLVLLLVTIFYPYLGYSYSVHVMKTCFCKEKQYTYY